MLPGEGPKQGVGVGCTAHELWEEVGQDTPFRAIYKEVLIADGKLRNQPRKEHESRREQRKIQLGMKGKEEPEDTGGRGVWGGMGRAGPRQRLGSQCRNKLGVEKQESGGGHLGSVPKVPAVPGD